MYSGGMAKRVTGVGKHGKFHSHKTKRRLEVKKRMLELKAMKPRQRREAMRARV